jgi:SAM-dependent methyltransferase
MTNISFDRAAGYYDATRGYGEGAAEAIRDAIVAYTGASKRARFLELGVGTGRIALPFIRAGFDYTGVDISQAMMDQLAAKLAADQGAAGYRFELRQADATALPFADAAFDVILTVHVLHLVADWQAAVREARRVLRRGGWLVIGFDEGPEASRLEPHEALPAPARVRARWREIRRELGLDKPTGRSNLWGADERLVAYLQSLGARTDLVRLAEVARPAVSAREVAERQKARMYSSDWHTPDDLHAEASRRLDEWLAREVAAPDERVATTGHFAAVTATWS